ncbi:hypothetical protein [Methanosphaera sp. WGK6]|uniref:hypothetical protein n=1 Tax=Methanosphaera sp. WGK6 TaxID=1561964 RepID=UPI00084C1D7E|nr:hypothetical protein [Methanosphaera sp. WGK6]OED30357.1 hypothetical protein NL43_02990 [Methanosphaera sp. WGK6]
MAYNNEIDNLTTGILFINYLKDLGLTEVDGINIRNQLYFEYNNNHIPFSELKHHLNQLINQILENKGLKQVYDYSLDENEKYLIYLYNQKHTTMHCSKCNNIILYNDIYCHNCGEKTGYISSNVIGYLTTDSPDNNSTTLFDKNKNNMTNGNINRLYAIITYLILLDNKPFNLYRPEESLFTKYNITREELEYFMINTDLIITQELEDINYYTLGELYNIEELRNITRKYNLNSNGDKKTLITTLINNLDTKIVDEILEKRVYSVSNTGLTLIASNPQIFFYNKFLKQYTPNEFEEIYQANKNKLSLPQIGIIFLKEYEKKYLNEFKWQSYRNTLLNEYIIYDVIKNIDLKLELLLKIFICDINPWKDNELTNTYHPVIPFISETIKKIVEDYELNNTKLNAYFLKAVQDIKLPKLIISEDEIFKKLLELLTNKSINIIESEVLRNINKLTRNRKYIINTYENQEEVMKLLE